MKAIEMARRLARMDEKGSACKAYMLALQERQEASPEAEMEAALYLLQFGKDYKVSYTMFLELYNRGFFQKDILEVMNGAFYAPNAKLMRSRYEKNCKLLEKYPYFFHKEFIPFEQLPVRFYPYDDNSYVPYYVEKNVSGNIYARKTNELPAIISTT